MKIEYFEKEGRLWFSYEERVSRPTKVHQEVYNLYESSGKIPKKIRNQGKEAIKKYAERKVKADIKKQKAETKKYDKFAKNPDFPVSVEHRGKILKGRIFSAEDSVLQVRLEEPYQGEHYVNFGFGSAVVGKHIFDSPTSLSEHAIEAAQKLLIRIYEEKKHYKQHKEVIDLAERLNKS